MRSPEQLLQWDVLKAHAIEVEMFYTKEAVQIKGTVERLTGLPRSL